MLLLLCSEMPVDRVLVIKDGDAVSIEVFRCAPKTSIDDAVETDRSHRDGADRERFAPGEGTQCRVERGWSDARGGTEGGHGNLAAKSGPEGRIKENL